MFQYIVQPYDTIFSIAQKFGLEYKQIISSNPQVNNRPIFAGQIINIPGFTYKVRSMDTLNKISHKFDIPLKLLLSLNPQIIYNGNISVGQEVFITNNQVPVDITEKAAEIESNSISIMEDIDNEDWDKAIYKATLIKNDFNDIKPILISEPELIPTDLINLIENAIISLEGEINQKNVHGAKVQAFIISEYFPDILDILRQKYSE